MIEIARHWRLRKERYRLIGEICQNYGCGEKIFPPRDICPHCKQLAFVEHKFSGKGEVCSYTIVNDPPKGSEKSTSYPIALVKLKEGPTITARLTNLKKQWKKEKNNGTVREVLTFPQLEVGMPVEMTTRHLKEERGEKGQAAHGYMFRPTPGSNRAERQEEQVAY